MRVSSLRGFTLVELNIAIVFVAILLLGVATVVMSAGRTYQHGIALKGINQTGREVIDQLRRDISTGNANSLTFVAGDVGRLCLGQVSYVYNSAGLLNGSLTGTTVRNVSAPASPAIRLVRIEDNTAAWCDPSRYELTTADVYTELLQNDQRGPVAIHEMTVDELANTGDTENAKGLVALNITVGTNETNTVDGDTCRPPTDPANNFDSCAVRKFSTIVRVAGR